MAVLVSANRARPENLHEIARLRLIDVVEIATEPKLVKEAPRARAICIPATPDAFSIALVANDQALQRAVVQTKLTTFAQSFDRSDKHQVRRARTETRPRRNNKEFPRLEMCRRLQTNLCKMRNRITTAFGHLPDLLKNEVVAVAGERELRRGNNKRRKDASSELFHRRINKHRNMIWQRHARNNQGRVGIAAGRVLNEVHAALHENEWRWERFYLVR